MKIKLKYLTNVLLDQFHVSYSKFDNPMLNVSKIYLLTGDDVFPPESLFIGKTSQLPQQPPHAEYLLPFLCVEDIPAPEAYLQDKNIVLLLCPQEVSVQALFNRANSIFSNVVQSIDSLWVFLSKIAATSSFTQLLSVVSSILNCSVALLSQGFKLLGYSEYGDAEASRTWKATLRRLYYPHTDMISQIRPTGLTILDTSSRRIVEDISNAPDSGDAFYPLLSEDSKSEILGFLYFSYNGKDAFLFNRYVIQFIAYALSFRMWRYIHSPANSNSSLCFLLRDIISGTIIDDEEILKRLNNIRFVPSDHTFLIVVYSSAMDRSQKFSWEHLKMVFGQLWVNDVLFTYNGDILILISSCEEDSLPEDKMEALTVLLREHSCYAGISNCFDRLDRSLRNYYVRTLAAAKMARSFNMEKRFTTYADVAMLHFVQEGASMGNLRDLCDPRILRLAAYDNNHSSNYIYTLQCYWHFNQDIQSTCNHLFIHRNTLFYRLKKIKEIVDLDFSNSKHLIQFNLSFAILTALGDIPYNDFPVAFSDAQSED